MIVSLEQAQKEVDALVKYKNLSETRKEEKKGNIEKLVKLVSDGTLRINEDSFEITQILNFGIGEAEAIKQLVYKPRVNVGVLQLNMKGIDAMEDMVGYTIAYGATLTGQPKNVIKAMDSEDFNVVQTLMGFFS